jgi:hypothetical protein
MLADVREHGGIKKFYLMFDYISYEQVFQQFTYFRIEISIIDGLIYWHS